MSTALVNLGFPGNSMASRKIPRVGFLDMSPEVRVAIYQLVFQGANLNLVLPISEHSDASMLQVNKQTRLEAEPVSYRLVLFKTNSTNLFVPFTSLHTIPYILRRKNAKHVENVEIDAFSS